MNADDLELYAAAHTRAVINYHLAREAKIDAIAAYELAQTVLNNSKANLYKVMHNG